MSIDVLRNGNKVFNGTVEEFLPIARKMHARGTLSALTLVGVEMGSILRML